MRTFLLATALAGLVAMATPAVAQIDQSEESAKSGELETLKQRLAPHDDAQDIAELVVAETALRRLHDAKTIGERRQIAAELDLALVQLRLIADRTGR